MEKKERKLCPLPDISLPIAFTIPNGMTHFKNQQVKKLYFPLLYDRTHTINPPWKAYHIYNLVNIEDADSYRLTFQMHLVMHLKQQN